MTKQKHAESTQGKSNKNSGKVRTSGIVHTYTGNWVDLTNLEDQEFTAADVAWGLGRIIRFNGHIGADYTVAHHSLIMSHAVPEEYALEALLHDCAEAYIGDVIWPVKAMFPGISVFENRVAARIMKSLAPEKELPIVDGRYVKSDVIAKADWDLGLHEWWVMRDGEPGVCSPVYAKAFDTVYKKYEGDFLEQGQPWWAFLRRLHDLLGTAYEFNHYCDIYFPSKEVGEQEAEAAVMALEGTL